MPYPLARATADPAPPPRRLAPRIEACNGPAMATKTHEGRLTSSHVRSRSDDRKPYCLPASVRACMVGCLSAAAVAARPHLTSVPGGPPERTPLPAFSTAPAVGKRVLGRHVGQRAPRTRMPHAAMMAPASCSKPMYTLASLPPCRRLSSPCPLPLPSRPCLPLLGAPWSPGALRGMWAPP